MKAKILLLVLLGLLTVGIHALLHDRYRIFYEDDVWSPSHTHTWVTTGKAVDRVFHTPERNVRWTFGRTYDFVYGGLAQVFGWSRSGLHLIAKLLVLLGAFCWFRSARGLGYGRELAWALFFGLLLLEPIVSTANISRKDALAFCLIAVQFLLMVKGRYLEGALAAGVAFETHPLGSLTLFLSAALLWTRRRELLPQGMWKKTLLKLAAGGALGIAYFVLLHLDTFSLANFTKAYARSDTFSGFKMDYGWNNFLYVYLVHERHFVQLGFFLLAGALFVWKRDWREDRLPLLLLGALFVFSLVIKRPNLHYMTYAAPVLLLFAFRTLERHRRFALLALVLFGFLAGSYVDRHVRHRDFTNGAMSARVRPLVPADGLPVVAQPDLWFAFRERRFIPTHFMDPWNELALKEFYFIRDDWAAAYDPWFYKRAVAWCYSNATVTPVATAVRVGKYLLRVERVRKK